MRNGQIIPYNGITPQIDESVFICEGARIIGDVVIGKNSSIWFNAVVRGDVNYIRIGDNTNIQDGAILHNTFKKYPLIIGSNVTIGHGALVHGCNVSDFVLIGMGAVILDDARIGSNSFIAAGTLVREHFVVPEGVLVAGVPSKIVRDLTEEEIKKIKQSAENYLYYISVYRSTQDKK
ncbi:MAG: gamma carbonic anhydrase family protein [Ignavibacteria bacterium]